MLARTNGYAQLIENHTQIVVVNALDIKRNDGAFILRCAINLQAVNLTQQLLAITCNISLVLLYGLKVKAVKVLHSLTQAYCADIVCRTRLIL